MAEKEEYQKVDCTIKARTDDAWLVEFEDIECWVPRSCCMNGHKNFEAEEEVVLYIAKWKYDELIGES